jgi:hypothetical protein
MVAERDAALKASGDGESEAAVEEKKEQPEEGGEQKAEEGVPRPVPAAIITRGINPLAPLAGFNPGALKVTLFFFKIPVCMWCVC